jgi:hypothetical protein
MRVRFLLGACLLVAAVMVGCGRDPVLGLGVPEQLYLYSLDGRYFEPGQEPKTAEKFHGVPVLGKVEITDPEKRREIVAALKDGVARSDGKTAGCFWPRHGLRVVEKGQTLDYVICFECLQLEVHAGGSKKTKPTTWAPQAVFNKHLKEAGLPLAPGMVGEEGK